jgi:hypothetical protein
MKRIILLFGLIFSLVAVKANAGEAPGNEQKAHRNATMMQKVLTLSDEQTVKVEAVLLKTFNEQDAIKSDPSKGTAAKQAANDALQNTKEQELKAIMTPDQFALYLQKQEERKTRSIAH